MTGTRNSVNHNKTREIHELILKTCKDKFWPVAYKLLERNPPLPYAYQLLLLLTITTYHSDKNTFAEKYSLNHFTKNLQDARASLLLPRGASKPIVIGGEIDTTIGLGIQDFMSAMHLAKKINDSLVVSIISDYVNEHKTILGLHLSQEVIQQKIRAKTIKYFPVLAFIEPLKTSQASTDQQPIKIESPEQLTIGVKAEKEETNTHIDSPPRIDKISFANIITTKAYLNNHIENPNDRLTTVATPIMDSNIQETKIDLMGMAAALVDCEQEYNSAQSTYKSLISAAQAEGQQAPTVESPSRLSAALAATDKDIEVAERNYRLRM